MPNYIKNLETASPLTTPHGGGTYGLKKGSKVVLYLTRFMPGLVVLGEATYLGRKRAKKTTLGLYYIKKGQLCDVYEDANLNQVWEYEVYADSVENFNTKVLPLYSGKVEVLSIEGWRAYMEVPLFTFIAAHRVFTDKSATLEELNAIHEDLEVPPFDIIYNTVESFRKQYTDPTELLYRALLFTLNQLKGVGKLETSTPASIILQSVIHQIVFGNKLTTDLNKSQAEKDGKKVSEYKFVSRYSVDDPYTDFVDLDALERNILHQLI